MIRRLRVHAGLWAAVAAPGAMLVFVLGAAPPTASRVHDSALRRTLAEAAYPVRDLLFSGVIPAQNPEPWPDPQRLADDVGRGLPEPVRAAVGSAWGAVRANPVTLDGPGVSRAPAGAPPKVELLHHTGIDDGVTLIEGARPRTGPQPDGSGPSVVQVMVADAVAGALGLRVGADYELRPHLGTPVPVRVTGRFTLRDESATAWAPYRTLNRTGLVLEGPPGAGIERTTAILATDQAGIEVLQADPASWTLLSELRYRLDEHRLDAGDVAPLRAGVARANSGNQFPTLRLRTGLDGLLADFTRQATAAQALLVVVAAGIAGTAAGLVVLAARLAVERRRTEFALLRARGAALRQLAARLAAESATVVAPGLVAAWLVSRMVPGRDPPAVLTGWLPALAAVGTVVAVPLAAVAAHRYGAPGEQRRDVVRRRPAPLRLTAELGLGALAVLGVVLLRRRGLAPSGVDPYLAAVPVLAGAALGLTVLRLFPWPVRLLGRLAGRGRGGAAFLGLARAGRAPAASALPLVVLVLAIGVGGFAGSVTAGIADARDVAAVRVVGGDVRLSAAEFTPDAADRVAGVPGVTAVASGYLAAPGSLRTADEVPVDPGIAVLVLDVGAYQRVLDAAGAPLRLPADLAAARPGGPVPVVVSPTLRGHPALIAALDGGPRPLRVVGMLDALPGLSRVDFVVIPREALGPAVARSSVMFVAGRQADPAAVRTAARVRPEARPDDPVGPGGPAATTDAVGAQSADATVLVRAELRRALERSGFNDGITLAFTAAVLAAVLGSLLAVGLALLADAAQRARALSLLRALGLAPGPARRLLLAEVLPVLLTALAAGAALGLSLPALLAPALGLGAFAAGVPVAPGFDGPSAALLSGALLLFTAGAVLAGAAAHRRRALGELLRVEQ